jgi:two-component system, chemotaxis family, sensor kinase Cph1
MAARSFFSTGFARRSWWRELIPYLLAGLVVLVAVAALLSVDAMEQQKVMTSRRAAVRADLDVIRSRLTNSLTTPLLATRGMMAQIVTHGDVSSAEFDSVAKVLVDGHPSVRNMTLSRGTVIAMVYPLAGNESILGVDYRLRPQQWPIVSLAMDTGHPFLQGPVALIQGGTGLILRTPVYLGPHQKFFGLISIVITISEVLAEAGLDNDDLPVNIAIRGRDGLGASGEAFFGDDSIFARSPVELEVRFPHGVWVLAGEPRDGWSLNRDLFVMRMLGAGFVLLIAVAGFGAAANIANRERVGRALAAQNRQIEDLSQFNAKIIAESVIGMMAFTADGPCVVGNGAAARILGGAVEDLLARNFRDLPAWQSAGLLPLAESALACGQIQHFSSPYLTDLGETLWLDGDFSAFVVNDIPLLLFSFRDISARIAADRIMREKTEQLERSNADLERFAYIASHDLQTPLRSVVSYTQLLDRRYRGRLDADADEFISFIVDGAKHMSQLILDTLAYARAAGHGKPLTAVDTTRAVSAALNLLRTDMDEAGAQIHVGALPVIPADETQMISLFQNLIGNSLRYRSPDRPPEISVTAENHGGDQWRFAIHDNGIGIDEEYFDKIFQMFHRLDPHRYTEGTGIGLAICQRIVHRLGGNIWVSSKVGEGTTFYFTVGDGAPS